MSYENLVKLAQQSIAEHHQDLVCLNDDLADHPEVGTKEYETSRKMVELLRSKGYKVEYPFAGLDTSYRAVCGENNHKYKIAIMAEYDALPEIGHGCGHCLSGTMSMLAGFALKDLQDELNADIHIVGTPDEEYNGGKPKMIRAGVFDEYDLATMIHVFDCNQIYTKVLAVDTYTYYFYGQAAHASAAPWEGRNAFNAAQLMFHGIDMLRQHVTPDVRIHGIIRYPGEAPNIVPERTEVEMYIRGAEREYLNEVIRKVDDCARGAAIATQTEWKKEATAEVYDNFKMLPFGLEKLGEVYDEMGIPRDLKREAELFGSSDAGNVSFICPTFHSTLQVVEPGVSLHTKEFAAAMKTDRAHDVMKQGAEVISRHVIKMLENEENIKTLKEEFERL